MELNEEQKKSLFSQRMEITRNQIKILRKLYENIDDDSFNTDVDLSEFSTPSLRDFSIYTSGFMSIQNFEAMIDKMSDEEIDGILEGRFVIKAIDNDGTKALARASNIVLPKGGVPQIVKLQSIQDGTYSIEKKQKINGTISPAIVLKTDPVVIFTNKELTLECSQVLKNIRNLLVHSVPFIDGKNLVFVEDEYDTQITKMWLRGYSELFIKKMLDIDSEKIKEILNEQYPSGSKAFENKEDVDKALSKIKECFPENIQQNYFRVNNFVKTRIDCYSDFYAMPIDRQISILAEICSRNENYINGNFETINPSIVYNIQQLVSKEISGRDDPYTYDDESDELMQELKKRLDGVKQYQKKIEEDYNNHAIPASRKEKLMKSHAQSYNYIMKQLDAQIKRLEQRVTMENAYMKFFSPEGIKHLPVEVGVNVVCLMAYTGLVSSGLYEDINEYAMPSNLSQNQTQYFNRLNFNGISLTRNNSKKDHNFTANDKCIMLTYIRNSLCHGNISFKLPSKKKDKDVSFKDTILTFYSDWYDMQITGSLENFYNLFSHPAFSEEKYRREVYGPHKKPQTKDEDENEDDFYQDDYSDLLRHSDNDMLHKPKQPEPDEPKQPEPDGSKQPGEE